MKRLLKLGVTGVLAAAVFTSCATKAYVDEQIAPVKDKQAELEKRLSNVEQEIASLKKDVSANKDKIANLEQEQKNIKQRLNEIDSKATQALNTAQMADKKADRNAEDIADLKDQLKRTNENLQNLIEKKLTK